MSENVNHQTFHDLVCEPISDVCLSLNTVIGVWRILSYHFEMEREVIEGDKTAQLDYINSYSDIQTLIDVLGNYIFPSHEKLTKALDAYYEIRAKSA